LDTNRTGASSRFTKIAAPMENADKSVFCTF